MKYKKFYRKVINFVNSNTPTKQDHVFIQCLPFTRTCFDVPF